MKQDYMQRHIEIQNTKSILYASIVGDQTILKLSSNSIFVPSHPSVGDGGRLCKGPPSRSRRPGAGNGQYTGQPPDAAATPDRVQNPVGGDDNNQIPLNTEYQILNDKQIPNFLTLLNFTKMKKQILILAFFVLALLAGTSKSYGQCATDALHPQANVSYNYSTPAAGPGATYEWYVTTNPDIKAKDKQTAGTLFTVTGTLATQSVAITWTAAAVELARTTPIYLALWYTETTTSTTTCSVENVRALQIAPVNTFLLAITGVDGAGATSTTVCAAPVLTALVDNPANVAGGEDNDDASMRIIYGTNTITYKITASGVNGDWSPRVRIPALTGAGQSYVSVEWSTSPNSGFAAFSPSATATGGGTYTPTADVPVTVAGSAYYVRLVIDQTSYESLADQVLNVAVDGYLATNHTVSDIDDSGNCVEATPFFRNADVTILHRPTITPGTPAFMTKTP